MPLTPIHNPPHEAPEGFWFGMKDGSRVVRILVTGEALQDVESPPAADRDRFDAYRSHFEGIAQAKHASQQLEADGTIRI